MERVGKFSNWRIFLMVWLRKICVIYVNVYYVSERFFQINVHVVSVCEISTLRSVSSITRNRIIKSLISRKYVGKF